MNSDEGQLQKDRQSEAAFEQPPPYLSEWST